MRPQHVVINARDIASTLTVRVTYRNLWHVRLGLVIMKLGAMICGLRFHSLPAPSDVVAAGVQQALGRKDGSQ